jgi:hypothetical protein
LEKGRRAHLANEAKEGDFGIIFLGCCCCFFFFFFIF